MKTALKLILVYFLAGLASSFLVIPFVMGYSLLVDGSLEGADARTMPAALVANGVLVCLYLGYKGYLKNDGKMYSPVSPAFLGGSLVAGASLIFLLDFLLSVLPPLPDILSAQFDAVQSSWAGILFVSVCGPFVEECLFRRGVTGALLKSFRPAAAIVLSGLLFGIVHFNPAQVVPACLAGFLFAWLYYRTGSIVPGLAVHVLNNGASVYFDLAHPGTESLAGLMGRPAYVAALVASALLFVLALWGLSRSRRAA